MAKKPQENEGSDLVRTVVSNASRYVFDNVIGKINEELRLVLLTLEKKGYQMQERMLARVFSFLTMVLACLFIVLGIRAFLQEYLNLNNTEAYLIVGVALLVAYFLMNRKGESGNDTQED